MVSDLMAVSRLGRVYGCGVEFSLDLLGGKWKTVILARLKEGPLRYGELRRLIPGLSDKILSERLQGLCEAGLIEPISSSVGKGYRLSHRGASLRPLLQALYDWGEASAPAMGVRIRNTSD
jgi:DNA-binding HxlR family transcriptional regulator